MPNGGSLDAVGSTAAAAAAAAATTAITPMPVPDVTSGGGIIIGPISGAVEKHDGADGATLTPGAAPLTPGDTLVDAADSSPLSRARRASSVFFHTVVVMRAVVKFQAAYRRVCARRKMLEAQAQMQQRQKEGVGDEDDEADEADDEADSIYPMVALRGTMQGTSGWYQYQDRQQEMVAKFDIDEQVIYNRASCNLQ
jgi:hypothetical protein